MRQSLIDLQLHHHGWFTSEQGAIRGAPFVGARLVPREEAVASASEAIADGSFGALVGRWNGFFSVVAWAGANVGIAVDRARSIPLYYSLAGERPVVSDIASVLRRGARDPTFDRIRVTELLTAGIVLNDATLCPEIRQVQSGEAIRLSNDREDGRWRAAPLSRRCFRPGGMGIDAAGRPADEYEGVLERVFDRTVNVGRGRQIVVPLSGGLDSRILLLMLVRSGARNLLAYTYGAMAEEVARSEYVAKGLGVPWRHCDYGHEEWRKVAGDEQFLAYIANAGGLAAVPCIQEWLAVRQLAAEGALSPDAVFMPGYAADLPAGSFLTALGTEGRDALDSRRALVSLLRRDRLSEWRAEGIGVREFAGVEKALEQSIDSIGDAVDWVSAYDTWMFNEKVPKFTVNAIRAFESHGYDWWLPFFDEEFLSFWEHVPTELRLGERLHSEVADRLFVEIAGARPPAPSGKAKARVEGSGATGRSLERMLRSIGLGVYSTALFKGVRNKRRRRALEEWFRQEPMGWTALFSTEDFVEMGLRGANGINGMLAAWSLSLLRDEDRATRYGWHSLQAR